MADIKAKKKQLERDAQGKSAEFYRYQKEQRAIAYGVCSGATIISFGIGAAICFPTAAATLETKLNRYRDKKNRMIRDKDAQITRMNDAVNKISRTSG